MSFELGSRILDIQLKTATRLGEMALVALG
jgi:hypothetical protein